MAQYSKSRKKYYHKGNDDIYEVVMLSDQFGNLIGPANPSGVAVDAFGRQRISTPYTLFDSSNIGLKNQKFDEYVTGTGLISYDEDESAVILANGLNAGNKIIRQSRRRFSYQPGKSLLILHTFVLAEPREGLSQKVGYFDSNDGIYLSVDEEVVELVQRSSSSGSVVETKVAQANWNSDAFDGNGTSHITLDITKSHIFWIDIEWLGTGSVRCGFVIDGKFIVAHTFHNANINTAVYMKTPNLPIRYEIENLSSLTSEPTMKQICNSVISEGGYEARALAHVHGTALSGNSTITANTFVNLVTIKISKSGSIIVPAGADVLNISNTDFEWALFKNASPFTGSFSYNPATNRVDIAINAVDVIGGEKIAGGYMGGKTAPVSLGEGFSWDYQLGETIQGNSDTLTLAVRATTTSKSAAGVLKWYEL